MKRTVVVTLLVAVFGTAGCGVLDTYSSYTPTAQVSPESSFLPPVPDWEWQTPPPPTHPAGVTPETVVYSKELADKGDEINTYLLKRAVGCVKRLGFDPETDDAPKQLEYDPYEQALYGYENLRFGSPASEEDEGDMGPFYPVGGCYGSALAAVFDEPQRFVRSRYWVHRAEEGLYKRVNFKRHDEPITFGDTTAFGKPRKSDLADAVAEWSTMVVTAHQKIADAEESGIPISVPVPTGVPTNSD